jgi:5-methyltetrahydrofolate--homocysteine methyltransferase
MQEDLSKLRLAIIDGDEDAAASITEALLSGNVDPVKIIDGAVTPALKEVGQKLATGEIFIPDLILAGEAAKASTNILTPAIARTGGAKYIGKIILGVVEGDTHDIGKNIVKAMLIAAGFEVIDLGTTVSAHQFIDAIKTEKPNIVGASAYTSPTALEIGRLTEALEKTGVRNTVKVVIGGAGVYRDDLLRFGADAYGYDAAEAVEICLRLVGRPTA